MDPIPIDSELKARAIECLNIAFQDIPFYQTIVFPKIQRIVDDVEFFDDIDKKTTKVLIDRYFVEEEFSSLREPGEYMIYQIKVILSSLHVFLLYHDPRHQEKIWANTQHLLTQYPQFGRQDQEELGLLLRFRNFVKIALMIIPPHKNKKFLLDIGGRLEGRTVYSEYITGSGQKDAVKRRLVIYYQEGKLDTPEAQSLLSIQMFPNRPAAQPRERPNANRKRVENVHLTPELIDRLSRSPADYVTEILELHPYLRQRSELTREHPDPRILEYIAIIKRAFSDVQHFSSLMNYPLELLIDNQLHLMDEGHCNGTIITHINEEMITKHCFHLEVFISKDQKKVLERIRQIMTACKLLLLNETPAGQSSHYSTVFQLCENYSDFHSLRDSDGYELLYLLRFRNFMRLGMMTVPGKPKIFLLRVVERLEGADNSYITGKGQTDATDRRVGIFKQESEDPHASLVPPRSVTLPSSHTHRLPFFSISSSISITSSSQLPPPPHSSTEVNSNTTSNHHGEEIVRKRSLEDGPMPPRKLDRAVTHHWIHVQDGPVNMIDPVPSIDRDVFSRQTSETLPHVTTDLYQQLLFQQQLEQQQQLEHDPGMGYPYHVQIPAASIDIPAEYHEGIVHEEYDNEKIGNDLIDNFDDLIGGHDDNEDHYKPAEITGNNNNNNNDNNNTYGLIPAPPSASSRLSLMRQASGSTAASARGSGGGGVHENQHQIHTPADAILLQKEFGPVPLHAFFQPLFTMPRRSVSQIQSSHQQQEEHGNNITNTVTEVGLDSVEVFNYPFTETIFGFFDFTESIQRQTSETIEKQHSQNIKPDA
jgi:hypothetical protein